MLSSFAKWYYTLSFAALILLIILAEKVLKIVIKVSLRIRYLFNIWWAKLRFFYISYQSLANIARNLRIFLKRCFQGQTQIRETFINVKRETFKLTYFMCVILSLKEQCTLCNLWHHVTKLAYTSTLQFKGLKLTFEKF